ncbi:helix-turn-helix domain-containing protein [Lutibacter maritimus]|uniref:DNA-binding transcriptional regulator, XRE-family HTH domain n=1 Tax=Lutibacter maritimus TaxID=593133 RepID=A0A1I6SI55_9FLAO|nr:helix-turn-helix transcriptional regulator [Lutibacter maritimus]SFS76599.1 DNA-binding transcriptional regulator, XRE-family HTH domain [Lutibacter maritimus]
MNKLLKYREKLNLTQEELAEKAGVSTRTIQRIEKGTEPKGHTLKVLAKALGISEDDLKENKSESKTKIINYQLAKYINLSSIFGVVFPPLNIILPFLIMKYKKQANEVNKQIISVQVLYTIIGVVVCGLSLFIPKWLGTTKQLFLMTLISFPIINLFIIIRNAIELDKSQKLYIRLNFSLI